MEFASEVNFKLVNIWKFNSVFADPASIESLIIN